MSRLRIFIARPSVRSETSKLVMEPLWITLKTALVATLLSFIAAILLARWRLRQGRSLGLFTDSLLMLPVALPPTVVGLGLLLFFGRKSPVGSILYTIGWHVAFSWSAAVIASFLVCFPILYQTSRTAFFQVDRDLVDLARISGFSEWRILWQVMVPLAWPGVAAGLLLGFVRALGEFGATLMFAGNIPGRTQTAAVAIYSAVESGNQSEAITLSLVLVAVAASAVVLLNSSSRPS